LIAGSSTRGVITAKGVAASTPLPLRHKGVQNNFTLGNLCTSGRTHIGAPSRKWGPKEPPQGKGTGESRPRRKYAGRYLVALSSFRPFPTSRQDQTQTRGAAAQKSQTKSTKHTESRSETLHSSPRTRAQPRDTQAGRKNKRRTDADSPHATTRRPPHRSRTRDARGPH